MKTTITGDVLIGLETAKLAKEKGFDTVSPHYYFKDGSEGNNIQQLLYKSSEFDDIYVVSTQSVLQKWLREKHGVQIYVEGVVADEVKKGYDYFVYRTFEEHCEQMLEKLSKSDEELEAERSETYEDALEIALVKGLKMIEI
jgi:hypothetical protein